MAAVTVAQNRAEADRLRGEAEEFRSRAGTLDRRANALENTAPTSESGGGIVQPLEPFALSPKDAARVESCSVTTVYERIKLGEYKTVRDGARTRVTMESIKARRAKLPRAEIRPLAVAL